ncbi:MAG: ABC transporter ATP-binding protein [Pseudomonadota bacterium]
MSIILEGVSKRFGGRAAVDNVSLSLEPGQFVAIVGASGCGKSTLLRLIAGLETLSSGRILLNGKTVAEDGHSTPPEEREVGFVFQSYALWPHLTVLGNVAFPAEARGAAMREANAQAMQHLDTVALRAFADRKPEALSGGQRQRVALARCLAGGANIILMDEPLANLDPHLRGTMERELLAFHRESGATTLYITHDQREAMALADQLAVMEEGRFLQVGPPDEIYDRPGNATVARFIGQGALQPVMVRDGRAQIGKSSFATEAADGPGQALFRPSDLDLTDPSGEALTGIVSSTTYRGGAWEAIVTVDGLSEPFEVTSPVRLNVGEPVGLRILRGWVLPG